MFDTFDSRALRLADCYAQRFMKPGTYRYAVLPAGAHCLTDERPFVINVGNESTRKKMNQETVLVTAERGRFGVAKDQQEVRIEPGDLVLWHCADRGAMPFTVVGDKEFFGSHRLVNESGYSHAFSAAGEYHWADAYGSGAGGVVRVRDLACREPSDLKKWREKMSRATVVMISDGHAEPAEVEIAVGQTVFFAVTKGQGISITDRRMLEAHRARHGPGEKTEHGRSPATAG